MGDDAERFLGQGACSQGESMADIHSIAVLRMRCHRSRPGVVLRCDPAVRTFCFTFRKSSTFSCLQRCTTYSLRRAPERGRAGACQSTPGSEAGATPASSSSGLIRLSRALCAPGAPPHL